jgi:hypothetical protein
VNKNRHVPEFKNSFLLLQRLKWIDEPEKSYQIDLKDVPSEFNAMLLQFDRDGDWAGTWQSRVRQLSPEALWRLKPRQALYPGIISPSNPVLLSLGEIAFSELSDGRSEELKVFREDVLKCVFSGQNNDYFSPYHFLSIVYLEPIQELLAVNAPQPNVLAFIERFRAKLHESTSVAVPQLFEDLIVFPGVLGPDLDHDLLVVRQRPLKRDDSRYVLPRSVVRLAELISTVSRLETGRRAVEENPILKTSPADYLHMLTRDIDKRRHRLSIGRDRKLAKAYESHLTHRLAGIEASKSVRFLAKDYKAASNSFETNARRTQDSWLWETELVSGNSRRYGIISSHWRRLTEAGKLIEQAAIELDARDRAVSNYLRDYFNAEVARSNLAVQRAVHRLTIVAIVVALIALLMQLPMATIKNILSK